jgi:hypothetical protein
MSPERPLEGAGSARPNWANWPNFGSFPQVSPAVSCAGVAGEKTNPLRGDLTVQLTATGWLILIATPLGVWLGRAIFRPMAPCRWCRGRSRAGDRKRWRDLDCSHCGNTRKRMTWGGKLVRGQGRGWGR